ncbi:MAG: type II secretion system protein GspE, partial [Desulfobacterales bacterium]|nr:type II secretion system protein GspE [Desulfobacterales bacterium]
MKLIGKTLSEICGLSELALNEALRIQGEKGGMVGEILIRQKAIKESDLLKALSIQHDLPYVSKLSRDDLSTDFTEKVPIQFLKMHNMVPIMTSKERTIAIHNPLLFQALDDLRLILGMDDANVVISPHSAIISIINFAYDTSGDSAEQVIEDMHEEDTNQLYSAIEETGDLLDDTSDAPVIKLVNLMLSQAVKDGASDIHIEPSQNKFNI